MSTIFRSWTCTLNQSPASNATLGAQAQSILRARKDAYKAAGWTVTGSSDSSTAAFDASDRWTADNKLVWDSGGNARSWIVLKSPTNTPSTGKSVYVLLALSTGSTNQHLVNETHSSSAFSGGSTTSDPTCSASTFRTFSNKQFLRSPVANAHYHAMYSTVGDVLFFVSTDGAGYPQFSAGFATSTNSESGLNFPCLSWSSYQNSTPGGMNVASLYAVGNCATWMQDGSISSNGGVGQYYNGSGATLPAQFSGAQGTIASVSKWLLIPATIWIEGTPSGGSATAGFGGTLVDISLAPTGASTTQATEEPAGPATSTTAKFGEFMVPNGGTTPVF